MEVDILKFVQTWNFSNPLYQHQKKKTTYQ